ncbi:hypothetical protein FGO68_gene17173 [Halteria grandinella]|uniref:Uncharacterized protein n=1 Tax=Halteria grandinella TaxID=5974 RepID=A0A8J8NRF9_HALGN|nr:hypothetical protein FGO68_gene17173 [Halteria grandinella]
MYNANIYKLNNSNHQQQTPQSIKLAQRKESLSKLQQKRRSLNSLNRIDSYITRVQEQRDVAQLSDMLSGFYVNPNAFKARETDPRLPGYVSLKGYTGEKERAEKARQAFKNLYVVNEGAYQGNGKVTERPRMLGKEKGRFFDFGTNPKTEADRIMKSHDFNKIGFPSGLISASEQKLTNPKQKWLSEEGFKTGLKTKFFKN